MALDEVLKDRCGINYDRGTPEDVADSRRLVRLLETRKGRRIIRYVAEAMARHKRD